MVEIYIKKYTKVLAKWYELNFCTRIIIMSIFFNFIPLFATNGWTKTRGKAYRKY